MLLLAEREREERETLEVNRLKLDRKNLAGDGMDVDVEIGNTENPDSKIITEEDGDADLDERLICCKHLVVCIKLANSSFTSWRVPLIDSTIEAPPSLIPQPRYCDITGLEVQGFLHILCFLLTNTLLGSIYGSFNGTPIPRQKHLHAHQVTGMWY